MPTPPRIRRPRSWFATRFLLAALLVVLTAFAGGLVAKVSTDRAAAADAAAAYTPPPFSSRVQVQRVISVVGDAFVAPRKGASQQDAWPALVAANLNTQPFVQAVKDGGYVKVGSVDATTFVDRSSQVAPGARAVVFFGGTADRGADSFTLVQAVSEALAEAHRVAPNARIVVVGPAYVGEAPADVLRVRDAIRSACLLSKAEFVDPISANWLPAGSKYQTAAANAWTPAGQQMVADRMRAILAPLVRGD